MPGGDMVLYADAFPDADALCAALMEEVPWRQEAITVFGRTHDMPRLTCWMGDASYTYSGLTNVPAAWVPPVDMIRRRVERLAEQTFNGVLLNLYRGGADSMGWHADDEMALGLNPVIASVSLGSIRRFRFKPKPHFRAKTFGIDLPPGSVLIMRGETQANWMHAIPKTARDVGPRINLTFRRIVGD